MPSESSTGALATMSANNDMVPALFRPRALLWTLLALVAVIAFFEITNVDLYVQDWFFDFQNNTWILPAPDDARWVNVIFYTGPKVLIITLGVILILSTILPNGIRHPFPHIFMHLRRARVIVVILTLATAPALIGFIKAKTNIHYPCTIERYGGTVPYVRLFEKFSEDKRPPNRSAGFPGGHCSGGFALLSLACLATTRRGRIAAIALGLGVGWWMGLFQMLRGVHYLSHTLVSMLICWAVFLLWFQLMRAVQRKFSKTPKHPSHVQSQFRTNKLLPFA